MALNTLYRSQWMTSRGASWMFSHSVTIYCHQNLWINLKNGMAREYSQNWKIWWEESLKLPPELGDSWLAIKSTGKLWYFPQGGATTSKLCRRSWDDASPAAQLTLTEVLNSCAQTFTWCDVKALNQLWGQEVFVNLVYVVLKQSLVKENNKRAPNGTRSAGSGR